MRGKLCTRRYDNSQLHKESASVTVKSPVVATKQKGKHTRATARSVHNKYFTSRLRDSLALPSSHGEQVSSSGPSEPKGKQSHRFHCTAPFKLLLAYIGAGSALNASKQENSSRGQGRSGSLMHYYLVSGRLSVALWELLLVVRSATRVHCKAQNMKGGRGDANFRLCQECRVFG